MECIQKISAVHERVDDIPVIIALLLMMLRAFRGVTLSRLRINGETHWRLSPLSETQKRILKLLGFSSRWFSKLIPTISKTDFQSL